MEGIIPLLASIASLTGISIKDILKSRKNKVLQRDIYDSVNPLLVRLQEEDDPLVGYWKLQSWDYTSEHLPNYVVSGGLAVHHRDRKNKSWKATMCLDYGIGPSKKSPRKWGQPHPFIATYSISFYQEENEEISGSCHMIEKREIHNGIIFKKIAEPANNYKWRGEFTKCNIEKNGSARRFIGKYENYPKKHSSGQAEFVFHLPMKWGEITLTNFIY